MRKANETLHRSFTPSNITGTTTHPRYKRVALKHPISRIPSFARALPEVRLSCLVKTAANFRFQPTYGLTASCPNRTRSEYSFAWGLATNNLPCRGCVWQVPLAYVLY